MVITKTWCFLENCIRGEATDVGVTHFPSLVALLEAVLGRRAFATWCCWGRRAFATSVYCCDHMDFSRFSTIFVNLHFFHITSPSNHSGNTGEADGPLQFLDTGAAGRRKGAVQLEAAAARVQGRGWLGWSAKPNHQETSV